MEDKIKIRLLSLVRHIYIYKVFLEILISGKWRKERPLWRHFLSVFLEWLCLVLGEPVNTSNVEMKVAGGVLPVVGKLRKCQGSLQHVP